MAARKPDPRQVDNRNRVALPRPVLDLLEVGPGDFVLFQVEDGKVCVYRADISIASAKKR